MARPRRATKATTKATTPKATKATTTKATTTKPTKPKSYKALTTLNLPFIEKLVRPGEAVTLDELQAAQQSEEDIATLVRDGALGGEDDDLHPSTIIPDPSMPTIQMVVAQAKQAVQEMEEAGDEVPPELQAVAELDYAAVVSGEEGSSSDSTS